MKAFYLIGYWLFFIPTFILATVCWFLMFPTGVVSNFFANKLNNIEHEERKNDRT